MVCVKPHDSATILNSLELYDGPVSLTTVSGIPCLDMAAFNLEMTAAKVQLYSLSSSENLL